jgi:predicted metal-dependent phosphoesterase TrpH
MHSELDIDAIEIFNSRYFSGVANEIARRKAARRNIIAVVGSDAHSAECVGLATVEVEIEVETETEAERVEAILRRLKEGKVRIKSCKRTSFWVYLKQLFLKKKNPNA